MKHHKITSLLAGKIVKFCIYPAAKTQAWEQKSVGPIVWTVEGSLVWMEIKSRNVVPEMEN